MRRPLLMICALLTASLDSLGYQHVVDDGSKVLCRKSIRSKKLGLRRLGGSWTRVRWRKLAQSRAKERAGIVRKKLSWLGKRPYRVPDFCHGKSAAITSCLQQEKKKEAQAKRMPSYGICMSDVQPA